MIYYLEYKTRSNPSKQRSEYLSKKKDKEDVKNNED